MTCSLLGNCYNEIRCYQYDGTVTQIFLEGPKICIFTLHLTTGAWSRYSNIHLQMAIGYSWKKPQCLYMDYQNVKIWSPAPPKKPLFRRLLKPVVLILACDDTIFKKNALIFSRRFCKIRDFCTPPKTNKKILDPRKKKYI